MLVSKDSPLGEYLSELGEEDSLLEPCGIQEEGSLHKHHDSKSENTFLNACYDILIDILDNAPLYSILLFMARHKYPLIAIMLITGLCFGNLLCLIPSSVLALLPRENYAKSILKMVLNKKRLSVSNLAVELLSNLRTSVKALEEIELVSRGYSKKSLTIPPIGNIERTTVFFSTCLCAREHNAILMEQLLNELNGWVEKIAYIRLPLDLKYENPVSLLELRQLLKILEEEFEVLFYELNKFSKENTADVLCLLHNLSSVKNILLRYRNQPRNPLKEFEKEHDAFALKKEEVTLQPKFLQQLLLLRTKAFLLYSGRDTPALVSSISHDIDILKDFWLEHLSQNRSEQDYSPPTESPSEEPVSEEVFEAECSQYEQKLNELRDRMNEDKYLFEDSTGPEYFKLTQPKLSREERIAQRKLKLEEERRAQEERNKSLEMLGELKQVISCRTNTA